MIVKFGKCDILLKNEFSMAGKLEEKAKAEYLEAYRCFNKCQYGRAFEIGRTCLEIASSGSYWYSGALGLCCWAANFQDKQEYVEQYAQMLLKADAGNEKPWFDGIAYFNLGLLSKRRGDQEQSTENFRKACQRYSCYQVPGDVPVSWKYVNRFFIAVSSFVATGDIRHMESLKVLLWDIKHANPDESEIGNLMTSVDLYISYAKKEDVAIKALAAIKEGVSPAFLAFLVL